MIVNSTQLDNAAAKVRRRQRPLRIHGEGVKVNAAQCEAAARLLREAEPSICNGDVQERPGFIERRAQRSPKTLVFQVGILPPTGYEIDRRGGVTELKPELEFVND